MQFARSWPVWVLSVLVLFSAALVYHYWQTSNSPTPIVQQTVQGQGPSVQHISLAVTVDADDVSQGVQLQQLDHPCFQFGEGGATLQGMARDQQNGRPIPGAQVWLTLTPTPFTPAAALLQTHTDRAGRYTVPHLADGRYIVAAARPLRNATHELVYGQATRSLTVAGQSDVRVDLALQRLPTGTRHLLPGQLRNLVVVELNGIYAETWSGGDSALAPTIQQLVGQGTTATNMWADYGWPPVDDNVLATGSYPGWRIFDPWPHLVPWGTLDGIDVQTWYGITNNLTSNQMGSDQYWGQDSVFDVARRYGLSTAWLGTPGRQPPHLNPAAFTIVRTLAAPRDWVSALAAALSRLSRTPDGFLLWITLAPPAAPQGEQEPSPGAIGSRYAQTVALYDTFVGDLRRHLITQHLDNTTGLLLTAGEAQAGQSSTANFYGLGAVGRGTSLHVPFIVTGPGIPAHHWDRPMNADVVAPTITALLGLPAPIGARGTAVSFLGHEPNAS